MPKYTRSMKPEDWLVDYSTAVSIANDNKRVAVKYVPLMLQGTVCTWLNSLKPYSVNSWVDFTPRSSFTTSPAPTSGRPSLASFLYASKAPPSPRATT